MKNRFADFIVEFVKCSLSADSARMKYIALRKKNILCLIFVLLLFIAPGGNVKVITFSQFREQIKIDNIDEFEIYVDGTEISAPVTDHKCIFVQVITFCGEDDIKSSYRTWNSDNEFYIVFKNYRVEVDRVRIRTFIEETGTFNSKDPDDGRMLPSVEYGLIKGKKYYAVFSSEEYHLPPVGENGKPQKKFNHVIWISSKPFINGKPQVELTPLYKNWQY